MGGFFLVVVEVVLVAVTLFATSVFVLTAGGVEVPFVSQVAIEPTDEAGVDAMSLLLLEVNVDALCNLPDLANDEDVAQFDFLLLRLEMDVVDDELSAADSSVVGVDAIDEDAGVTLEQGKLDLRADSLINGKCVGRVGGKEEVTWAELAGQDACSNADRAELPAADLFDAVDVVFVAAQDVNFDAAVFVVAVVDDALEVTDVPLSAVTSLLKLPD